MNIEQINQKFYVTAQIDVEDLENLKLEGFDSIVCNRPDHEEPDQPLAVDLEQECKKLGLKFLHLPMTAPIYNEVNKAPLLELLNGAEKTLGFCKTGRRALVLYKGANNL